MKSDKSPEDLVDQGSWGCDTSADSQGWPVWGSLGQKEGHCCTWRRGCKEAEGLEGAHGRGIEGKTGLWANGP